MDIQYLLFLQNIRELTGGVFDTFVLHITELGEAIVTYLLLALIYWCVDKRTGGLMALNVSIACTWNQFIKRVCKIERPWVKDERVVPVQSALATATGYSFPSGHTQRAVAVWGALGHGFKNNKEKAVSLICYGVALAVAFSRNYLGVHTPQDVIVAAVSGFILIIVLDKCIAWADAGENRDYLIAFVGCVLCFLPMLKVGCLTNAGTGMGFLIGWALERHFVRFDTNGSFKEKCLRFTCGALIAVLFMSTVSTILTYVMESKYAGFFANFFLAMFIMVGYPFFFSKRERYKYGAALMGVILATMICFILPQAEKAKEVEENTAAESLASYEKEIQIIAHRGYSSMFPENTMAAFEGALELGVDYVELDVQLSKDGEIFILHDTDLIRTTGVSGVAAEFTYEQMAQMDAGSWFAPEFAGEKIPTLEEALERIKETDCKVYLELKDIGEAKGYAKKVLDITKESDMLENTVFASFNYQYLQEIKTADSNARILFNTQSEKASIVSEYPAEYYGLYLESVNGDLVDAIHENGSQAFVWTVDTPQAITNVIELGVDGIVTNKPGLATVLVHPEYDFLVENYESSFTMPGLYENWLPDKCQDVVVQGFTKSPNYMFISAYSKAGESSILFVMNREGKLLNIVDLQFVAHTGGIAYDSVHDYIWVTGPEGKVYAISYSEVINNTYQGDILVEFDAGLVNHNGSKVASFLTWYENELFVGSYVDGSNGLLNCYDLSDVSSPALVSTVDIPQRIQGITFWKDATDGTVTMYLSQGYQTLDAGLLCFDYSKDCTSYTEPRESYVLPEGAEQIQATAKGMYMLFESAALPYRPTSRIVNDQVYLVRMP